MSYISAAKKLWHALIFSVRLAHAMCKLAARMDARIQASTMSAGTKAASTTLLGSINNFCDLIQAEKDASPST